MAILNPVLRPVLSPVFSLIADGRSRGASSLAMPTGALGLWYADEYQATPRPHIPNKSSVGGISANLFAAPRRLFLNNAFYTRTGVTVTDEAATAPDGSNDASTVVAAANWYMGTVSGYNIPAGTYTMAVSAKRNTGSDQSFAFSKDNTASRSGAMVATSVWQRFSYTFTLAGSTNAATLLLCSFNGSTGANLQICDFELYAGSADLGPGVPSGHLYLGQNAFDARPAYANGELNLSTGGWGQSQLANNFTATAATTIALVSKVSAGSAYQAWLSKIQAYSDFSAYTEISISPYGGINTTTQLNSTGLWQLLNKGYHALTHYYDGSVSQLWIDDILLFSVSGALTAKTVKDLFVGVVNAADLSSGLKISGMALYNRALSANEIRTAYSALKARAETNGVAVTASQRIYAAEGDSITRAAESYAYKFGANASPAVLGNVVAISGSGIASMQARAATVDAILPPSKTGRKFILSVMIGRNDLLSLGVTAYLTNLAAYLDARRAAGWIVVLGTILPATAAGFNAARNTANATLVTWVGVHCDALADFAADPIMGPDAAASNATYYPDGTHPSNAGQVILEAVIRPVINAL